MSHANPAYVGMNPYAALRHSVVGEGCLPCSRAVSPALLARTTVGYQGGPTVGAVGDMSTIWPALAIASSGLSAYHGYARNQSIGWAAAWGVLGALFPIITPAVALAQGFGERK